MITKPTVFVLGAGASAVFNFPTGQGLCELVIDYFGRRPRENLLNVTEFAPKDLDIFGKSFSAPGRTRSIYFGIQT